MHQGDSLCWPSSKPSVLWDLGRCIFVVFAPTRENENGDFGDRGLSEGQLFQFQPQSSGPGENSCTLARLKRRRRTGRGGPAATPTGRFTTSEFSTFSASGRDLESLPWRIRLGVRSRDRALTLGHYHPRDERTEPRRPRHGLHRGGSIGDVRWPGGASGVINRETHGPKSSIATCP